MTGGFPHSEIPGSTLVYKLPEAYRMLQRPSSPLTAKAFTVCAYSLDPITPIRLDIIRISLARTHCCYTMLFVQPFQIVKDLIQ